MEYEFKWDCNKCWYKDVCSKFGTPECNNQCIRYSEMDYLMYLSNIPKARQTPYSLIAQQDDLDAFMYLKSIKDNVKDFVDNGDSLFIHSDNSGNGKAQPLSAFVLAENGYKQMKDIHIGDKVFGDDGNLHNIIGVFPQGEQEVYEISFSDNSKTYCTKEHLWAVQSNHNGFKVLTTEQIANKLNFDKVTASMLAGNTQSYSYRIPLCNPISFEEKYVEIEPYIFGLIVGNYLMTNRNTQSTLVNIKDKNIIDNLNQICETNSNIELECTNKTKGNYNVYIDNNRITFKFNGSSVNEITNICNAMRKYIYNDVDIRYDFLKGIIDIAGRFRTKTNVIRLVGKVDLRLFNLIQTTVELLGGTCQIEDFNNTVRGSYYTRKEQKVDKKLIAYIDLPTENYKKYCSSTIYENTISQLDSVSYTPRRFITGIKFSHKEECQCIKLDSKSELYLTNDCIVTHNTSWAIKILQEYFNQVWYGNRYRCRGLFVFVPTFLNDIKRNMYNRSKEFDDFENRIIKADLVIWDDIGSTRLSEFDHSQLLSYINQRDLDLKANIYTSNLDYNELLNNLGSRLMSRIWNKSIRVRLVGMDMRGIEDGDITDT